MSSWLDKFYENSWLKIVRQNGTTGALEVGGAVIPGVSSYSLAAFKDGGFDLTVARHVLVSDAYADTDSQPSLWYIQPTASTQKRKLVSQYVVFSTIALLEAEFPAASYPGIRGLITSLNGIIVKSNGTRYVPINGRAALYGGTYGTLAAPTLTAGAGSTSFTFNIGTPPVPANMLAVGDKLEWTFRVQRHNANATIPLKLCLGTAGTTSDANVWTGSLPATDLLICNATIFSHVASATTLCTNGSGAITGTGVAGIAVDVTANFNIASAMTITIGGTKNTSDTIDLLEWSVNWVAK